MRLTESQTRELAAAIADRLGLAECRSNNGLGRASWTRKMDRMCAAGLFKPYVHGGYEITEAGRTAYYDGVYG